MTDVKIQGTEASSVQYKYNASHIYDFQFSRKHILEAKKKKAKSICEINLSSLFKLKMSKILFQYAIHVKSIGIFYILLFMVK